MDARGSLEELDRDFEFSQLTFTSVTITELDENKDELFAFFTKRKHAKKIALTSETLAQIFLYLTAKQYK